MAFFCYNIKIYILSEAPPYPMGRSDLQKLLEQKKRAKTELFKKCWPEAKPDHPLLIIFVKDDKRTHELTFKLLEGLLILHAHVIVVSENEPADHLKHPQGKVTWVNPENGRNAPKIDQWLMAADMALVFDEKQAGIHTLFQKGVVPIGFEKSPLLTNYHPNEETGNSFTYNVLDAWSVFATIVRACETYRFPYDWQHIVREMLKVR